MSVIELQPGYRLTVTAGDRLASVVPVDDASAHEIVSSSKVFGPFQFYRTFKVLDGTATVSADATVIDHLITSGAGAPVNAVRATASVNPTGDDNALTFTAVEYGTGGNSLSVTYVDPGQNDAALSVVVAGPAIVVRLATGETGTITSTAAEVLDAITASIAASRLCTAAINTADSGVADDGSGVVTAMARTAFTSGAGTGIGRTVKGGIYLDTTNGNIYRNSGTQAAPAWTQVNA
jgi:hypothetical protein